MAFSSININFNPSELRRASITAARNNLAQLRARFLRGDFSFPGSSDSQSGQSEFFEDNDFFREPRPRGPRTVRSFPESLLRGLDRVELSLESVRRFKFRSIDGKNNNIRHPSTGQAGTPLRRIGPTNYVDGIESPAGADRLNPRVISNVLSRQTESNPNARGLSSILWQWGQFIDHDIDLTPEMEPNERADIPVLAGDPWFDPLGSGTVTIPFKRSRYDPDVETSRSNPRQQINEITAWLDASNVYGSDPERAAWLRTGENGKLKTSEGNLLPFNDGTQENAMGPSTHFFVAGDVRANEQTGLSAFHTLFVREHNRLAEGIKEEHPHLNDEQIYQRARKFVSAIIQSITYNEFLPALLGPNAISPYEGYKPSVNASISNEFSTAFYRLGHSMLPSRLLRLDNNGDEIPSGHLELRDAFFKPERITEEGGIEPILKGLISQQMEELDLEVVDDVRNFLFGPPGAGGLDLVALNIQRGRDHGLADYNTLRETFDLPRVTSFNEITSDPELAARLKAVYKNVDNIDPWVGALAEDHLPGASVGRLLFVALKDQFERLRDGDRFWYENDPMLTRAEVQRINQTTLSEIIKRNTDLDHIQPNTFFVPTHLRTDRDI